MKPRSLVVIVAIAAAAAFCWWLDPFDAGAVPPTHGPAAARPPEAASASAGVGDAAPAAREPVDADSTSETAENPLGALLLRVVDSRGAPIRDVRAALLPPAPDGVAWDDSVLQQIADDATADQYAVLATNHEGTVLFPALSPSPDYQLAILSEGLFYFDAQPSPFIVLPAEGRDDQERRVTLRLDGKMKTRSIASLRVSGRVPVMPDTTTKTRVTRYTGGTVKGRVLGGPWPRCVVSLNRVDASVRRSVARSVGQSFRFEDLVPAGRYDIEAQLQDGQHYWFCAADVEVHEGTETSVELTPIEPEAETALSLDLIGEVLDPDHPVAVSVLMIRENPRAMSDVVVRRGEPVVLHGMRDALVTVNLISPSRAGDLSIGSPKVRDLVAGRLAQQSHVITVKVGGRARNIVGRKVRLVPPDGLQYAAPVSIKFRDGDDDRLAGIHFAVGESEGEALMDWGLLMTVDAQARVPDIEESALSTRLCQTRWNGVVFEVLDPGPPNGAGVKPK